MGRRLAWAAWIGVAVLGGCLQGRADLEEEAPIDALEAALVDGVEECPVAPAARVHDRAPDRIDTDLCVALHERDEACHPGCEPIDAAVCAPGFACARQLWRPELVDDVYACIAERPCDDLDPAHSCLAQVVERRGATLAQRDFERALDALDPVCKAHIDISAGQSDAVYQRLTRCLDDHDACADQTECVFDAANALVDESC